MLPLANKPLLEHIVTSLSGAGIRDFVFVVGYCSEVIRDYFGSGHALGVHIAYALQEEQLGTGHALLMVRDLVEGRFLVANGDAIVGEADFRKILSHPGEAMVLARVSDTQGLGTVEVEGNCVKRIHEKVDNPPTQLANAGVYLLDSDIFDLLSEARESERGEYEIVDALQSRIDAGHPMEHECIDSWLHMSYCWDLLSANEVLMADMQEERAGVVEEGAVLKEPVSVGKGTVVKAYSYIEGPVIIGEDCRIGPSCYLRPSTCIGNGCHIGASVEVKNSIIMNNTNVPHFNYVGDSVIGEGCNLGAGTKVANLRLDKGNITIGGIDTGRRKLGVIMGDNVQTGINASLNIGTVIGNNSVVVPGALATGILRPRSRVLRKRQRLPEPDII
jgi:bifunctional UDP-N-acetylglucosamine pyrophosphorylase/glucosamine-1-phosphate N-acetyltransferase